MPKARSAEGESEASSPGLVERAAGLVRDNPKTAIAAGAAVAAGVATAAVIGARRGKSSGGSRKSGGGGGAKKKG
jgi:hypothetical protein